MLCGEARRCDAPRSTRRGRRATLALFDSLHSRAGSPVFRISREKGGQWSESNTLAGCFQSVCKTHREGQAPVENGGALSSRRNRTRPCTVSCPMLLLTFHKRAKALRSLRDDHCTAETRAVKPAQPTPRLFRCGTQTGTTFAGQKTRRRVVLHKGVFERFQRTGEWHL